MGGYENLDEYEDDGFIDDELVDKKQVSDDQEDETEEEEDQEEVWMPSKDETEFLTYREQLKLQMRRKMNKGNPSVATERLKNLNFGNFFGPSQPSIALRVIEESRSLQLSSRVLNPRQSLQSQDSPAPADASPKVVVSKPKKKAQILKDSRDYAFLASDDAELPAPTKVLSPSNGVVPNSDAQAAKVTSKSKKSVGSPSKPVLNGRASKQGQQHRKVQPSSNGNGLKQTQGTKGSPPKSKTQMKPSALNKASVPDRNCPPSDAQKTVLPRPHPSGLQKPLPKSQTAPSKPRPHKQGKDNGELDKSRAKPKQPVPCSTAPKVKTPEQLPSRPPAPKDRRKKRSMSPDPENYQPGDIYRMLGYNPAKYRDDGDDRSMEASFNEIQREERISLKYGKKEDDQDLMLTEEMERKEREEKMRKKREGMERKESEEKMRKKRKTSAVGSD